MSNFAHSDKANMAKNKEIKDKYEAEILKLTNENVKLSKENGEQKTKIDELENQVKEWRNKYDL